jgi:hypothetical protein
VLTRGFGSDDDDDVLGCTPIIQDICHGLMTTSGSGENKARRRLRVLGRLAFRYLAIQCLAPGASPADRSAAQQHLLETIVQDLELSISFLHQKRQDLGRVMSSGDIGTPPPATSHHWPPPAITTPFPLRLSRSLELFD